MDETDLRILRQLQIEPDLSAADLAERVGLSHTPCWRRLKRLEAEGVILGRALMLAQKPLGLSVDVFANIRLKHHDEDTLESFERTVLRHAEIVECFSMSGDVDYIVRVVARSMEEYERFLKKVLLHLPGVTAVHSSFALKRVKLTTALPI